MGKKELKNIVARLKRNGKILLIGFIRILHGAATLGLVALSGFGFACVATENGYIAVFDFIAACATSSIAFANIYMIGEWRRERNDRT